MPFPIGIQLEIPEAYETLLSTRKRNQLFRLMWQNIGDKWAQEMFPQRFGPQQGKYNLAARAGEQSGTGGKAFWKSYTGRKKKKHGHTLALVASGVSAARAMQEIRVKAGPSGCIIRWPAGAFRWKPPHTDIDMEKEVKRITPDEMRQLAATGSRMLTQTLSRLTGRSTKRL